MVRINTFTEFTRFELAYNNSASGQQKLDSRCGCLFWWIMLVPSIVTIAGLEPLQVNVVFDCDPKLFLDQRAGCG